jgi:hypothetical protein
MPTSIEEFSSQFSLYPNPATHTLNVEIAGSNSKTARVELLDGTGRTLETREVPGW